MRLLVALVMLLCGCGSSGAGRQKVRLVVAGTPSGIHYVPHTVAVQMGLYKSEGLEFDVDVVSGGTRALQALIGGSADVVLGFFDHPVRMAAQGRPVRSFVTLARYPGNVLVVSPSSAARIKRIQDLRGAAVGVSDLGTQAHLFLKYLLARNGVNTEDVQVIATGHQPNAIAALERGRIDAWSGFDPGVTQLLRRHPGIRILSDLRSEAGVLDVLGSPTYPGSVLYSTTAWLEQNRDAARRMASAIRRALRWIAANSPEQIAAHIPDSYKGPDHGIYVEALRAAMPIYSPDGLMPKEGAAAVQRVLAVSLNDARIVQIDVSRTFTNEFVQ